MAEYIRREAAIELCCKHSEATFNLTGEPVLIIKPDYVSVLRSIPAADVRPVVRGEWLTGNDNPRTYGRIRAMCGRCGAFALAEMVNAGSYKERLSNFCPNCGADMREES